MRLFFATDVHGSDVCFRKFVNAGKFYEADAIILGGDTTGKSVEFIIDRGDGTYASSFVSGKDGILGSAEELENVKKLISRSGYYPCCVTAERLEGLQRTPGALDQLFLEMMVGRMREWIALAESRLQGTGIRCVIAPGNDDDLIIDEVVKESSYVECGEDRVVDLEGYELVSCGWTNPTPWDTSRECSEEALRERIEALIKQVRSPSRAVFNLHAPPYATGLDDAPDLTKDIQYAAGGGTAAVGSTATKELVKEYQPLLGLFGHIHEGRATTKIGRTLCVNPGSVYSDGVLQGVIVDLKGDKVKSHLLVAG